ncbi:MAG: DUF393 domain-containing protein [Pseudomonadota bacterium]
MTEEHDLRVYYDGACPLCRREIDFYRGRSSTVTFEDVSSSGISTIDADLTRDEALKRFHVRTKDGRLLSGAKAFSELWKNTPSMRWLGIIVSTQPFLGIAEIAYSLFLKIRPFMQFAARKTMGE